MKCSNHGECVSGECHCAPGWTGEGCSKPDCPDACNSRVSACQEAASANLVGEEKLAKSKNAQISAQARHKVHATPKHLNARAKRMDWRRLQQEGLPRRL